MIMFDAMREYEIAERYKKLANDIDKYLSSRDSLSEGMYLSKKEYEMCAEALRNYGKKKGMRDVIRDWFTKR